MLTKQHFTKNKNLPCILVIDDQNINLDLLLQQIRLLGFECEGAEDGLTGLDLWKHGHYDLIITDCHMPKMDGYELTQSIRQIEKDKNRKHIPILAYTANTLDEDFQRCLAAGMNDIIVKPVSLSKLHAILSKWLGIESSATTEKMNSKPDPVNLDVLQSVLPDSTKHISLLHRFKDSQINGIKNLFANLESGNIHEVFLDAHRLKGACRMIGAQELSEIYETIESLIRNNQHDDLHLIPNVLHSAFERFDAYLSSLTDNLEKFTNEHS